MEIKEELEVNGRKVIIKGEKFSFGDYIFVNCINLENFLKREDEIIDEIYKKKKKSFSPKI